MDDIIGGKFEYDNGKQTNYFICVGESKRSIKLKPDSDFCSNTEFKWIPKQSIKWGKIKKNHYKITLVYKFYRDELQSEIDFNNMFIN